MKLLAIAFGLLLAAPLFAADDPTVVFRKKHADQTQHYTKLYLTSFETEIDRARETLRSRLTTTKQAIHVVVGKDADQKKLKEFMKHIDEAGKRSISVWEERKAQSHPGDILCVYEWQKGQHWRTGYLVLNDGDYQGEWVTAEGFGPEDEQKPEANKRPEGTPGKFPSSNPSQVPGAPHP